MVDTRPEKCGKAVDAFLVTTEFVPDYSLTKTHRLVAWRNRFRHLKTFEKDICKELIPVAWHPTSWWDWCMSEDEEK